MEQTDLELYLENNGVFTVDKVFDVLSENKIDNIAYVNIYQFGINKNGNIYNASIKYNDDFKSFSGSIDELPKKVKEFTKDKQCVTNYEGKSIKADPEIIDQIENHLSQFITIKQVIGSHELFNILISL